MYRFIDNGDRKVAMRYDQTVPLARVVAQYQNELPIPFKRYQIQNVWRAENTQRGRYREFLQVDVDAVGSYSLLTDAEIISIAIKSLEKLGFKNFKITINDRANFVGIDPSAILTIDKLKKIGKEGVLKELKDKGLPTSSLDEILNKQINDKLKTISDVLKDKRVIFDSSLARGLDYYTGLIFEVGVEGYDVGSIAGGGRYDDLVGMFAGRQIPAVGFAFGFDRLIEAMETLNLFPSELYTTKVLVAFENSELQKKALKIANELRDKKINSEVYPEDVNLEKQLKYADKKQIPYVVIINDKGFMMKDMGKRTQEELNLEQIVEKLK
jgi:histidyl-tRNA synthetase